MLHEKPREHQNQQESCGDFKSLMAILLINVEVFQLGLK